MTINSGLRRHLGAVLGASLAMMASAATVDATTLRVRIACAADYYSYCSQHPTDGQAVRQCFRTNGTKLSRQCVLALIAAGEVSREEVLRRAAAAGIAVR